MQACFSAEAEQADGPAAKWARTAGGANVGGVALAHRMWAHPASIPAAPRSRQLVELQRSGTAAMRAAAALELGALGEQSETAQSGTAAATELLRPLVALLQRGNADGKANSPFALGKTAADNAQRGSVRPMRSGCWSRCYRTAMPMARRTQDRAKCATAEIFSVHGASETVLRKLLKHCAKKLARINLKVMFSCTCVHA